MKPVQVMFEEKLLAELDKDEEVRRLGRSAVLRRVAAEYLKRRKRKQIAEAYKRAYAADGGLGEEWGGWSEEGVWPED